MGRQFSSYAVAPAVLVTSRGWESRGTSIIVAPLTRFAVVNLFVLIDEIEKAGRDIRDSDPVADLLTTSEPKTAKV
jgi:hypothetical protein